MKFFATVATSLLVLAQLGLGAPNPIADLESRGGPKRPLSLSAWFEDAMRSNYDVSLSPAEFDEVFEASWGQNVTLQANGRTGLTRPSLKAAIAGSKVNVTNIKLTFHNVISYLPTPGDESAGIVAGSMITTTTRRNAPKTKTETVFIMGIGPEAGVTTRDKRRILTDVTTTVPKN